MTTRAELKRLVPLTSLRHFYNRLRDFSSEEFHFQAIQECLRRPDRIQAMVGESFQHFELYENIDEAFRPTPGELTDDRQQNSKSANRMLRLIAANRVGESVNLPEFKFDFVDYEISPYRTTKSEFENGDLATSSGAGGMDILLSNRKDRLPCVGEIKAPGDFNSFFALIQGLMYAVEISTPSQRARLMKSYPDSFSWPSDGPWVDICLLFINHPSEDKFLRHLRMLVEKLLTPDAPIAQIIRSVSCLNCELGEDDAIKIKPLFELTGSVIVINNPVRE